MSMSKRNPSIRASFYEGSSGSSRSRSRILKQAAEESLDPVTIGDQMLFNASELLAAGFLHGDLASLRVGMQEFDLETKRDALNFNDYVFRVCPMLNYRQRNELDVSVSKEDMHNASHQSGIVLCVCSHVLLVLIIHDCVCA
jgi:hypothetical protein